MSKRFEEKKEAFELLNKELSDLIPLDQRIQNLKQEKKESGQTQTTPTPAKGIPKEWLEEQRALHEKYKLIERVYKFYRTIIQNMSSSIICIDMKGAITFVNVNAAKTLDYKIEELLGRNMIDIVAER